MKFSLFYSATRLCLVWRLSVLTLGCLMTSALSAQAADFSVTSIADTGTGTLREALTLANATADTDSISFAIPEEQATGGVFVISPTTALPIITSPVAIRGYSQPGTRSNSLAAGTNAVIRIQLTGPTAIPTPFNGLEFGTGSERSVVRGLAIGGFASVDATAGVNATAGVFIGADEVRVEGCFLGTNAAGMAAAANSAGVVVSDASGALIGGQSPATRNLLSGNFGNGVVIQNISNSGAVTFILDNLIGTNATGTARLGNGVGGGEAQFAPSSGIAISDSSNTFIKNNVISGNNGIGVIIRQFNPNASGSTSDNILRSNLIGVGADGTTALGNNGDGVEISSADGTNGAKRNTIGREGEGNVISNNIGSGVLIAGNLTIGGTGSDNNDVTDNIITGNTMYGVLVTAVLAIDSAQLHFNNTLAGIDLTGDGITANDNLDADNGPNNLQNFPIITSSVISGRSALVAGTLNSTPNTNFVVEFFSNVAADSLGNGEGKTSLGGASVSTDANGSVSFSQTFSLPIMGEPSSRRRPPTSRPATPQSFQRRRPQLRPRNRRLSTQSLMKTTARATRALERELRFAKPLTPPIGWEMARPLASILLSLHPCKPSCFKPKLRFQHLPST
jgi:hypothetical protein